jgi:hypothetical protein
MDRWGWSELSAIASASDDLRGFLTWVRSAPEAARELSRHADALTFSDEHAAALARMRRSDATTPARAVRGGALLETPAASPSPLR